MNQKKSQYKGIAFLIFLLLIEMCWILGAKVSEQLIDLVAVDVSRNDIQTAESIYNYVVAATVLIWGILIDRFPSKRRIILLISNFLWIIASIIMYFISVDFPAYLGIQIIWGIAFGANGPILGSYLGDLFKIHKRGLLFSIFIVGVYIIKAGAIGITGLLGSYLGDWKAPSFIFAIIGVIVLVIFLIKSKEPKLAAVEPELEQKFDKGYEYDRRITFEGFISVIKQPTNLFFLFQGVTGMMGVTIVTRYLNYWFVSDTGMGMDVLSSNLMLGASVAIGSLFGIFLSGRWVDFQFKKKKMNRMLYFATVNLFLQVIFYFILTQVLEYPNSIAPENNNWTGIFNNYPVFYWFIVVFNFCSFFGTSIAPTVGTARTHINLPEHRGTVAALYDLFDFMGAGIGLLVGSMIWSITSNYQSTIMFGSLCWVASGILWIFASLTIKKDYLKIRNQLEIIASKLE